MELQRKEKIAIELFSLLAVRLKWGDDRQVGPKNSLVYPLALYMLKQSKLYIGGQICLPISLCLYENDYFCEEMKKRLAFLFWLHYLVLNRITFQRREWEQRKIAWKNTPNTGK